MHAAFREQVKLVEQEGDALDVMRRYPTRPLVPFVCASVAVGAAAEVGHAYNSGWQLSVVAGSMIGFAVGTAGREIKQDTTRRLARQTIAPEAQALIGEQYELFRIRSHTKPGEQEKPALALRWNGQQPETKGRTLDKSLEIITGLASSNNIQQIIIPKTLAARLPGHTQDHDKAVPFNAWLAEHKDRSGLGPLAILPEPEVQAFSVVEVQAMVETGNAAQRLQDAKPHLDLLRELSKAHTIPAQILEVTKEYASDPTLQRAAIIKACSAFLQNKIDTTSVTSNPLPFPQAPSHFIPRPQEGAKVTIDPATLGSREKVVQIDTSALPRENIATVIPDTANDDRPKGHTAQPRHSRRRVINSWSSLRGDVVLLGSDDGFRRVALPAAVGLEADHLTAYLKACTEARLKDQAAKLTTTLTPSQAVLAAVYHVRKATLGLLRDTPAQAALADATQLTDQAPQKVNPDRLRGNVAFYRSSVAIGATLLAAACTSLAGWGIGLTETQRLEQFGPAYSPYPVASGAYPHVRPGEWDQFAMGINRKITGFFDAITPPSPEAASKQSFMTDAVAWGNDDMNTIGGAGSDATYGIQWTIEPRANFKTDGLWVTDVKDAVDINSGAWSHSTTAMIAAGQADPIIGEATNITGMTGLYSTVEQELTKGELATANTRPYAIVRRSIVLDKPAITIPLPILKDTEVTAASLDGNPVVIEHDVLRNLYAAHLKTGAVGSKHHLEYLVKLQAKPSDNPQAGYFTRYSQDGKVYWPAANGRGVPEVVTAWKKVIPNLSLKPARRAQQEADYLHEHFSYSLSPVSDKNIKPGQENYIGRLVTHELEQGKQADCKLAATMIASSDSLLSVATGFHNNGTMLGKNILSTAELHAAVVDPHGEIIDGTPADNAHSGQTAYQDDSWLVSGSGYAPGQTQTGSKANHAPMPIPTEVPYGVGGLIAAGSMYGSRRKLSKAHSNILARRAVHILRTTPKNDLQTAVLTSQRSVFGQSQGMGVDNKPVAIPAASQAEIHNPQSLEKQLRSDYVVGKEARAVIRQQRPDTTSTRRTLRILRAADRARSLPQRPAGRGLLRRLHLRR